MLELRSNSYLNAARAQDVELHRAAADAGTLKTSKHRPQVFDMDERTQIEAANHVLLQQILKHVARDKKFKPQPWPSPETAADVIKRQDADRGYHDLMQEIVYMPQDEFDAHIAKHRDQQQEVRHQPGN